MSLPAVSRTAVGVAGLRALENNRPDRLFDDPYALAFFEAGRALYSKLDDGESNSTTALGSIFSAQVAIRTRFFDDYLLDAARSGCEQVVLLAAGLDARAFRLPWPEKARLFELDLPDVLEFKESVLARQSAKPRCTRTVIPVDLRDEWSGKLLAAGFRRTKPTVWLAEGLLIYLSYDEAERLLITVDELSAPGSQVSFEHRPQNADEILSRARVVPGAEHLTSLWKGGLGGRSVAWLEKRGWQVRAHPRSSLAAAYGRPSGETSDAGFLTATRN
ncbi:class I SAM-dependent methyltransferase [Amycolatopsis taiwanensis]|uniref:class I SAM-dependent methyltransferase n=1 Tax=Amycolatopsis taiwanensis TaxID=342230 RepID=UPI002557269F|nr:class I SAM-dependent methyltransferase [Amycolatopsis taiwanensis]